MFVLYIFVSVSALQISSLIYIYKYTIFFRFHKYALIYDICFSDLLYSVWRSLGPSTSLQKPQCCSFLWLEYSIVCLALSQFSRSVVSDTFRPHELQHTRLPCPSPAPGACPNLCPSSKWCDTTISSSVIPFSSAFNLSQHHGLFQWDSSSHQVARVLKFQLQHHSFQWILRTNFLWDWLVWSPCSPKDSEESLQHYSSASILWHSAFFIFQLSHPYITTGKTVTLTRQTFVGKVSAF